MWRRIRIALLLLILTTVIVDTWRTKYRVTSWNNSLRAVVYPINADGSSNTERYIAQLHADQFDALEDYLEAEAHRYGITVLRPVNLELAPTVRDLPPAPPRSGILQTILWSLQLRWWAWRHDSAGSLYPDIRLFVLYHDPAQTHQLDHSVGTDKGQIAVIKAFASQRQANTNLVVIGHELLHTVGATDKYDMTSLQPIYPDGYAEPAQQPLYPQAQAELMGGRIPLSENEADMPISLSETLIGPKTAQEIGWIHR